MKEPKVKLTKEILDTVRDIEGFPIGKDEDIIALSDPPYYTACPNPFINDFIEKHGTPYDEENDDYDVEPYAADVSEGKNDPIYNAHTYHTKVPHKAIMRYILHYTKPGDIVFDGFCGTGMTGVAAQMCGNPDPEFKLQIEKEMPGVEWGSRKSILIDLCPAATFISYNYNSKFIDEDFINSANEILDKFSNKYGWMYETTHIIGSSVQKNLHGEEIKGRINYTVWSDIILCKNCNRELVYWHVCVESDTGYRKKGNKFTCSYCGTIQNRKDIERAYETVYDDEIKKSVKRVKQKPILINYTVGNQKYEKMPDNTDLEILNKIERLKIEHYYPIEKIPNGINTRQPKASHFVNNIHHFYDKRSLIAFSFLWDEAQKYQSKNRLIFWLQSVGMGFTKLNRYFSSSYSQVNRYLKGTLYIAPIRAEVSPWYSLKGKINNIPKIPSNFNCIVSNNSVTDTRIGVNSIDYIFIDPPFGGNLMYSELNFIWESWLKISTNNSSEAIISEKQNKGINQYKKLMEQAFETMYSLLKPGRWITIVFHNSKNYIWNAIQESLTKVGFVPASIKILDKIQQTMKQYSTVSAVDKDLVISAYKPKDSFVKNFLTEAGTEEGAWNFVREHLKKLPVVVEKDGMLDIIPERQNYLLYDAMLAFHIQKGASIPLDAADFYKGLQQRFVERDRMYFLPDQVNKYDKKRIRMEVSGQLSLIVLNEKTAIQWLYKELEDNPQTYQDIQPKFLLELKQLKYEKLPELMEILEENFLQDKEGKWYIPDLNKRSDLEKLREKNLLKEFEEYRTSKGGLRVFRTEAVRAGFKKCWRDKDYKTIVKIGERLPARVVQEDSFILMYYDNACTRIGD